MRTRKTCTGPDCNRDASSYGLCRTHARQRDRGANLTPILPRQRAKRCTGPECQRDATNRGLCRAHRMQANRGQELEPIGAKRHAPRPERRKEPTVWGDPERIAEINRTEQRPASGDRTLGSVGVLRPVTAYEAGQALKRVMRQPDGLLLAEILGLEAA